MVSLFLKREALGRKYSRGGVMGQLPTGKTPIGQFPSRLLPTSTTPHFHNSPPGHLPNGQLPLRRLPIRTSIPHALGQFPHQNKSPSGSGADPGFSFGGGGDAKDYMRERTLRARNPKSLSAGIQGPLKGPGSSRGF